MPSLTRCSHALANAMLACQVVVSTTRAGAIAGMIGGGAMVFIWKLLIKPMGGLLGIYELLPAFLFSAILIAVVSLMTAPPDAKIMAEFEKAKNA